MATVEKHRTFLHGNKFAEFWRNYIQNHKFLPQEKVNIYFDFPYCVSNCKYCMIQPSNINEHRAEVPVYEEELVKLVSSFKDIFSMHQLGQISFGGGTASLMSRDCIRELMKIFGDNWDKAFTRKMEVHPHNLNPDYIHFLIDEVHITNLSMGIQTFNTDALKAQHRIPVNVSELRKNVQLLYDANIKVNMDLVAMFNGETEEDWQIFRDDMRIVREIFNPTMFFTQVNYATQERYYEHTLRLRKELVNYIDQCPEYVFADDKRYRNFDIRDVQEYLDTTYFMIKPDYFEYLKREHLYSSDPRYGNYIGFGGNIDHRAFSTTGEFHRILSYFDFVRKHWIHELQPDPEPLVVVVPHDQPIPTINCGRFVIPPYNPEISGEVN